MNFFTCSRSFWLIWPKFFARSWQHCKISEKGDAFQTGSTRIDLALGAFPVDGLGIGALIVGDVIVV
jgi:hypothetical protein